MQKFKQNIYKSSLEEVIIEPIRQDILLGYSDSTSALSCSNIITPVTRYILDTQDWITATFLYQYSTGTIPAIAGYYSDGSKWYYWDESTFTSTGFC